MKLNKVATLYYHFIVNFAIFLMVCCVFLSGLGRYRLVLAVAVYYLLIAIASSESTEKKINAIYPAVFLIALLLDIFKGPIYSLFARNYFILALVVMIVLIALVTKLSQNVIYKLTDGQLFIICPSCKYRHLDLVRTCNNCSYKKGDPLTVTMPKISKDFQGEAIPAWLLHMLVLGEGEEVVFYKKLTGKIPKYINGKRRLRRCLVITTNNVVMIDNIIFSRNPTSWREKDIIPLSEIQLVEGKTKNYFLRKGLGFVMRTYSGDTYEMLFIRFDRSTYVEIEKIAVIIKKANPQAEVSMNLSMPYGKEVMGSVPRPRWEMALIVIMFLIVILIAFWQPFIDLITSIFK